MTRRFEYHRNDEVLTVEFSYTKPLRASLDGPVEGGVEEVVVFEEDGTELDFEEYEYFLDDILDACQGVLRSDDAFFADLALSRRQQGD